MSNTRKVILKNGTQYPSVREFCRAHNLNYRSTISAMNKLGWSADRCISPRSDPKHRRHKTDYSRVSNFESVFPQKSIEWHPTKNGQLLPSQIAPKSNKKIWWLCSKDSRHEWQASVDSRARGCGCPYCSNKKVHLSNSLSSIHPDIAREWHAEKNGAMTPNDIVSGSNLSVWWQCPRSIDHVFKNSVSNRTRRGQSCPKCTSQTSIPEIRIYTEFLALFDNVDSRVKIGSKEIDIHIVDLNVGIEFDGHFFHKDKENKDRAKTKFLEDRGINVIRIRQRPLKTMKDYDVIVGRSDLKKADLNNIIKTILKSTGFSGGKKIDNYLISDKFVNEELFKSYVSFLPSPFPEKSLNKVNPALSSQWHFEKNFPLLPSNFTPKSGQKVWWRCMVNEKHEWEATIAHRSNGRNCPLCSGKQVDDDNSLKALYPKVALEWAEDLNDGLLPNQVSAKSGLKVWWRCKTVNQHIWATTIASRTNGSGCPKCHNLSKSDLKVQPVGKQLLSLYPHLSNEWDFYSNGDLRPEHVTKSSRVLISWVCSKNSNHKWKASANARGRLMSGCPHCHLKKRGYINESWEYKFNQLVIYKNKNGHCKVPQRHVTSSGFKLGQWVSYTRHRAKLTTQQVELLTEIGFI